MKAFYSIILLIFLASCTGETTIVENPTVADPIVQEVVTELDEATESIPDSNVIESDTSDTEVVQDAEEIIDDLIDQVVGSDNETEETADLESPNEEIQEIEVGDESEEQASVKVVELSTTYTNPQVEVVMNIEYSLDENDTISAIELSSPNYQGMARYNELIQWVIGLSVEEASEFAIAGSSLATPAYQAAMKKS